PREYLAKYASERVRNIGGAWLGATLGCCECHDHKFDPFTTRDFYRLEAFFADVKQWGVYSDYGYTPNPELKGFNNDYPFPPEIEVASPYLARRQERFRRQIHEVLAASATTLAADDRRWKAFEAWTQGARDVVRSAPDGWVVAPVVDVENAVKPVKPKAKAKGAAAKKAAKPAAGDPAATSTVVPQDDASLLITGKAVKGDQLRIRLRPAAGWLAAIRLELLPHETHKGMVTRDGAETTMVQVAAALR